MRHQSSWLVVAIWMIALLGFPQTGAAKLTPLTADEMDGFTAQAGISTIAGLVGVDMAVKTLYYGDDDGLGGGLPGAFLSLCDVALKESVEFAQPVTIDFTTAEDPFGDRGIPGIHIGINGVTVRMDSLKIGAVRVGPLPGIGLSFGSVGIIGMVAHVTGDVYLYAH